MPDDYSEIAGTETAAGAKTKINDTFKALRSNHSSTVDTGFTKVAGMFWFDTSNNALKMRDGDNADWITVGELDNTNNDFVHVVGAWKVSAVGTDLVFSYSGANKMKIDSSGNLTVVGNVTAYGTV